MKPEVIAPALLTLLGFVAGIAATRHLTTDPVVTVECQHAAFATVEDMRQVQFELVDCRRALDEIRP